MPMNESTELGFVAQGISNRTLCAPDSSECSNVHLPYRAAPPGNTRRGRFTEIFMFSFDCDNDILRRVQTPMWRFHRLSLTRDVEQ